MSTTPLIVFVETRIEVRVAGTPAMPQAEQLLRRRRHRLQHLLEPCLIRSGERLSSRGGRKRNASVLDFLLRDIPLFSSIGAPL